jgi:ribosomal protein S18 acetylase RimI-like enzyme
VRGRPTIEPLSADQSTAEVRYLGVRPDSWGGGIGRRLMALQGHLAAAGFARGELAAYRDNPRAVALYEGLGWRPHGDATPHLRSGRLEQRYRLTF